MSHQSDLTNFIGAFVDELSKSGIKKVVVSPGSRSTPIAMLVKEHPHLETIVHIDERSAAFFALGIAKSTNEPVAILCTSGTAAANYFPAIAEAYYSRVPLLAITADRPHELRDVGAPQTMDQVNLYGKHVKWFVDMPLPEGSEEMARYAREICSRAIYTAKTRPFGPVHINFPLREPLIPDLKDPMKYSAGLKKRVQLSVGEKICGDEHFQMFAKEMPEKGVIVCGPMELSDEKFRKAIIRVAEVYGYPILADPLSNLRSGTREKEEIIDTYDAFLRVDHARQLLKPEVIIRFGAMPVSKSLLFYLQDHRDVPQYVIDGGQGWRDPAGSATQMIYCDEASFCLMLLKHHSNGSKRKTDWQRFWIEINNRVKKQLASITIEDLSEGKIAFYLNQLLPDQASLMVGNSMPIRDVDMYFHRTDQSIELLGNRGLNGIDGIVSTALGVSLSAKHPYLLIGDLSFYHDLNGLLLAKLYGLKLTIILLNNNGGGIFSMLPQAKEPAHFESLFGTPIHLTFEYGVRLYDGEYEKVESWSDFLEAMERAKKNEGLTVIEVFTNRKKNAELRRKMQEMISREIENWIELGK
ncbi:2-succinyl-5-enolpyruvyl-6-hydroxy-3-cyclohexene-1-carboxylic-acid synthase [Fervidibacillus halotolerans]|uniref:2-succinyl-5-enolpyruvyl-6-hydroxy-3-cyclohexene-1-carboxylate synthase n=1 Tax=Fervidibacillus halotolerans TaxID=2980027 RepID=A0A9E8LYU8_9BACI|nr:2-succinyl-5-enolpyruvyl-6-hydroxy-3-cyclohexene-1-carboxylic-acid synthase [Fervidibacillus halotolerans]WAA11795.1 2-succinyl-5-enolpyruvyl-6-hydroxy-3-cyclohexene-1-carboxylic-acid synthase [Fervidibacillus halotolerans]